MPGGRTTSDTSVRLSMVARLQLDCFRNHDDANVPWLSQEGMPYHFRTQFQQSQNFNKFFFFDAIDRATTVLMELKYSR